MSLRLRTLSVLLLTLLVTSLASCGGGGGGGAQEPDSGPIALTRLLDPTMPIVAHIDADGLRQSPYYTTVRDALLESLPANDQDELRNVIQLLDRTDHLVVAVDPQQEAILFALRGAYQPSDLDLVDPPEGQFAHRQHALRGNEQAQGVVASADTMIIGSTDHVHRALDRLDGLAPATGPTLAGYAAAAERVQLGQRDLSVLVLLTDEIRANFGQGEVENALRESGLSAGASLDARNGIRLSAYFTASSEGAVQLLAAQLREALAEARSDMTLAMLGLSVLLQQIEITERGTDLLVEIRIDDQQVRDVLERFGPLLQAFLGMI